MCTGLASHACVHCQGLSYTCGVVVGYTTGGGIGWGWDCHCIAAVHCFEPGASHNRAVGGSLASGPPWPDCLGPQYNPWNCGESQGASSDWVLILHWCVGIIHGVFGPLEWVVGCIWVLPVHCGCWWPTAAVVVVFLWHCLVVVVAFGPVDVIVVEPRCWSHGARDGCPLELVWECVEVPCKWGALLEEYFACALVCIVFHSQLLVHQI